MENPWPKLPDRPPYVLPSDSQAVSLFNDRVDAEHKIHSELLPEPFLGDPNAPIVLLSLNPGFSEYDHLLFDDNYGRDISLKNLAHAELDYPFYLLDPRIADAPGPKWWRQRLGAPIRDVGVELVAKKVCCVEYFPYHTRKYRSMGKILDS